MTALPVVLHQKYIVLLTTLLMDPFEVIRRSETFNEIGKVTIDDIDCWHISKYSQQPDGGTV